MWDKDGKFDAEVSQGIVSVRKLLKNTYVYQTKDNNRQTGNKRKNWPFYREINTIVGTRASSEPVVVLENFGVANVEQERLEGNCVIVM